MPTWLENTGKSGHMTDAGYPCLPQGCKISDTLIFQPDSMSTNMLSAENGRNQTLQLSPRFWPCNMYIVDVKGKKKILTWEWMEVFQPVFHHHLCKIVLLYYSEMCLPVISPISVVLTLCNCPMPRLDGWVLSCIGMNLLASLVDECSGMSKSKLTEVPIRGGIPSFTFGLVFWIFSNDLRPTDGLQGKVYTIRQDRVYIGYRNSDEMTNWCTMCCIAKACRSTCSINSTKKHLYL